MAQEPKRFYSVLVSSSTDQPSWPKKVSDIERETKYWESTLPSGRFDQPGETEKHHRRHGELDHDGDSPLDWVVQVRHAQVHQRGHEDGKVDLELDLTADESTETGRCTLCEVDRDQLDGEAGHVEADDPSDGELGRAGCGDLESGAEIGEPDDDCHHLLPPETLHEGSTSPRSQKFSHYRRVPVSFVGTIANKMPVNIRVRRFSRPR